MATEQPQLRKARADRHIGKILLGIVSVAITIAAVWLLARQNQGFSFQEFASSVEGIAPGWFLAAAALSLVAYVMRTLRWVAFVESYAPQPSRREILANTFIGFAAVVIIGRPAELLRPYLIARQLRVPFPSQVGAWMLERIYDLLSILVLAGWAMLTIDADALPPDSPVTAGIHAGGGVVLVTALAALAILLAFTFAASAARARLEAVLAILPEGRRESAARLLEAFTNALGVSRNPLILGRIVGWTFLHWLVVGVSMWCIFQCFPEGTGVSFSESVRFLAILAVASAIPIPFLVGGYYLVSVVLLTEWLRLPMEPATGITLVAWVLQMGIAVPFGALAALRSGLNWRRIKSMEQEAHL